jgi:hypothetical protein
MSRARGLAVFAAGALSCSGPVDTAPVHEVCAGSLTDAPSTIAGVVDAINRMPLPATLPCFVEALPRPLCVEATADVFSVQPAMGQRSPRLFLRNGPLTLSVVPEGTGRTLLEMSETVAGDGRTLKAELVFPIEDPVEPADPFDRVLSPFGEGTSCGVCHADEGPGPTGALVSEPLRPIESSLVDLDWLAGEAAACDAELEPARCAMLTAVFGHGEVEHDPFPEHYPTIYDDQNTTP